MYLKTESVICTTIVEITGGGWTLMRDGVLLVTLKRDSVAGRTRKSRMISTG